MMKRLIEMKSIMIVCMVGLLFVATSVNAAVVVTSYARNSDDVGADTNGAFLHTDDVAELTGAAPTIGGVATNVTALTIASNQERTITYTVTGSGFDFSYDVIVTAWASEQGVESMVNIRENGGEVMPDSSMDGEHRQRIDSPDTVGAGNWEFLRLTIDNLVINGGILVSLQGFNMVRLDSTHPGADGNVENADTDAVIASWIGGVLDAEGKYRSDIDLTSAYASSIDLVATSNSLIDGKRENSENQPRGFAADFISVGPVPVSPANGETVPGSSALPLTWINADPNLATATETYVQVLFGTDPESLSEQLTVPATVSTIDVDALLDGTYYWRVDSYIEGDPATVDYTLPADPNVIKGLLWTINVVSDLSPTVQIDTPHTMTWSDGPVQLDATVVDEGSPDLYWTATPDGIDDPNLNVEFLPDAGTEDPQVIITNDTGSIVTVILTLAADDGNNDPVAASIELDVYPTPCDMARLGLGVSDIHDVNDDCVIDLVDFAAIASKWLEDFSATEPVAR